MVPNMYGVLSSIFDIFRLLQMASEDQKVMKKHRRPDFILVSGLLQPLIYNILQSIGITQLARKWKKVQAKKLVKSNKSKAFSLKLHFGSFKLLLFPSSKIDFWSFLKLQKMTVGQKIFSWNWFIWFHEFFWPGLF